MSVAPASVGVKTWARARLVSGETRTVPRSKNGGLVTTQSAASSMSPASRRSRGFKTSSLENARAGFKSVARYIHVGEPGQIGIDLDEIGERPSGL